MKSVFRTVALALLAILVSIPALADDYVKVSNKDGKETTFALSEKPEVTFTASELILKTTHETVSYPLSDMLTFEFTNEPAGVSLIESESGKALFSFNNTVKGKGLKTGSRVSIYTIGGQSVGSAIVDVYGQVEIPLNGQTGVFIVKSSTKTFKIIKK